MDYRTKCTSHIAFRLSVYACVGYPWSALVCTIFIGREELRKGWMRIGNITPITIVGSLLDKAAVSRFVHARLWLVESTHLRVEEAKRSVVQSLWQGIKRRFTMRYKLPHGARVGLPRLDGACRSPLDVWPVTECWKFLERKLVKHVGCSFSWGRLWELFGSWMLARISLCIVSSLAFRGLHVLVTMNTTILFLTVAYIQPWSWVAKKIHSPESASDSLQHPGAVLDS